MSTHSKTSKAILVLLAFSITIGTVAAQDSGTDIDLDDSDDIIWKDSNDVYLNATVKCGSNDVESVALLDEPVQTQAADTNDLVDDDSGSTWEIEYDIFNELTNPTGDYTIQAECAGDDSDDPEPATFSMDSLDFELQNVYDDEEWFIGFSNNFTVDVSSRSSNFEPDNMAMINFSITNDENDEAVSKERVSNLGDTTTLSTVGMDWEGFLDDKSSSVTLEAESYYSENEADGAFKITEDQRELNLNRWRISRINVNPDRSLTASQFSQLNLDASIYYKGDPINRINDEFGPENFYLDGKSQEKDGAQWFSGELIEDGEGRYSISLGPTPQELENTMSVVFDAEVEGNQDTVEVAEIDVENVDKYIWSTKVLTPSQDAVEADFRVNYEDSYVNFTSTNGDYSEKIWPGEHDVDVTFPEAELSLTEVDLEEDNSGRNILYNYIFYSEIDEIQSDSNHLEGIKPVNLASFNFAYPFEDGSLDMRFNNEQIDTSESVRVYECTEWHFGDKECRAEDGWEEIDDIQTIPASWKSTKYSTAEFNIEPHDSTDNGDILQNAYIVGTSADLLLNNGISVEGAGNDGRVETGGEVTVNGRIVSENDNFVEGAEVDVKFYEGSTDINSFDTVETDSEGRFSVTGEAPSEPGNYTVQIEAEAENYDDSEQRFDDSLETFIAEGIRLDVDSPLDVTLGEEVTTPVEVENTGQTEMENVELTFSGINSGFYSTTDSSFSSIEAGDSRTVQLTFDFPTSYCGEVCEDYPAMDITVDAENSEGGEFEDSDSIQTQITAVSDATSEESSDDPGETDNSGSFNAPDVAETTGEFLESQSSLNVALGLILVFLMVLAGAMKKKKEENDQRRGRNGSRPNVQRPNVQGQQNDAGDQESEDEVDDQIDEIADAFDEEESSQEEGSEDDVDEAIEEVGEAHEEADQEQEEESDSEDETFECDVCGEVFDSESGRKLHKKALH